MTHPPVPTEVHQVTEQSAETLRRAAAEIREDWPTVATSSQNAFMLAVADWLDAEFAHPFGPTAEAIDVARAYLGIARSHLGEASPVEHRLVGDHCSGCRQFGDPVPWELAEARGHSDEWL